MLNRLGTRDLTSRPESGLWAVADGMGGHAEGEFASRLAIESLISLPVLTSQWGCTDDELRDAGITRGMLRLSVGLEDVADLIGDLDQALG